MSVIYQYPLRLEEGIQMLSLPYASQIVLVGEQNGVPTLWFELNQIRPITTRSFRIFGTGDQIPDADGYVSPQHLGSYQFNGFVWHIYELIALNPRT